MTNHHLTDEDLQAMLLGEMKEDTFNMHLSACAACRAKLVNYQVLIDSIGKVAPESFSFDVSAMVMDSIIQYESKKSKKEEWVFWTLFILVVMIISILSFPFIAQLLTVFYSNSIFSTLLIAVTGFVVLLFLLADLSRQYRLKEENIFKNKLQPAL